MSKISSATLVAEETDEEEAEAEELRQLLTATGAASKGGGVEDSGATNVSSDGLSRVWPEFDEPACEAADCSSGKRSLKLTACACGAGSGSGGAAAWAGAMMLAGGTAWSTCPSAKIIRKEWRRTPPQW